MFGNLFPFSNYVVKVLPTIRLNYVMVWNRKKQQTTSLNAVVQFGHYTMNFSAFPLVKHPKNEVPPSLHNLL